MSSLNKYYEWINTHYPTKESARLACEKATRLMQEVFPELTRVRGHVLVGFNFRPHWWLTLNGEVIDPTRHQWEECIVAYQALPPEAEEPLGRCINCGKLSFKSTGGDSYRCGECVNTPWRAL